MLTSDTVSRRICPMYGCTVRNSCPSTGRTCW